MGRGAPRFLILLSVFFLSGVPAPVKAGTCKGEGEKAVLYLEYLFRRLETFTDLWLRSTLDILGGVSRFVHHRAASLVAQQTYWLIWAGLKDIDEHPAGSFERTSKFIVGAEAARPAPDARPAEATDAPLLRAAWQKALVAYVFCRAGALSDPSWCQAVEFDRQLSQDCLRMVWNAAIFIKAWCDPESVSRASEFMGADAEKLSRACQVFSAKNAGRCGELGEFQIECRAMLNDDEKECAAYQNEARRKACLNELNNYRSLNRVGPPPVIEAFDGTQKTFLFGTWYPDRCAEVAFRLWQISAPPHRRIPTGAISAFTVSGQPAASPGAAAESDGK